MNKGVEEGAKIGGKMTSQRGILSSRLFLLFTLFQILPSPAPALDKFLFPPPPEGGNNFRNFTLEENMNQKGGISGADVRNAHLVDNPLEHCQLSQTFTCKDEKEAVIKHFLAAKLTSKQKDWLMDLFARNMKPMYVKCIEGWQPRAKKIEMFSKRSRFLIVSVAGKPVAFSHFQFDMDYGRQVLYCYEVQVEQEWRGTGIGGFIMSTLEQMASKLKLPLVVLTVFKHNPEAHEFFKSQGYEVDETCPEEEEGMDYYILSKQIHIPDTTKKIQEASEVLAEISVANNSES